MSRKRNAFFTIAQSFAKACVFLSLTSCATICGDNTRTVCVSSHPESAGIYCEGKRLGTTPAQITFSNYIFNGKTLTLKKEGFHEQCIVINAQFQPCGLWNLLFLPAFLVDFATGNIVKINPAQLHVIADLEARALPASANEIKAS